MVRFGVWVGLFVFLGLVCSLGRGEIRFKACTYQDAACSQGEECETETSADCADVDKSGLFAGDVGIKVTCNSSLDGIHSVAYYLSDDCSGNALSTSQVNNMCVGRPNTLGFSNSFYLKIECYESAICFSRDSSVLLDSGVYTTLGEVRVGDRVQSVDDNGRSVFSEVFLTQHSSSTRPTAMLSISIENSHEPLVVTHDHYVRVPTVSNPYVKASSLRVGDSIYVVVKGSMERRPIAGISHAMGVPRNVHTMNDRIVVNGVVASCITSNQVFGLDTMNIRHLLVPLKVMHKMGLTSAVSIIDRAVHNIYRSFS
uniref:Hint domain-containing protein n=1 Tax=Compsopogon caeruleus TaxID=31354 RepID=A0A7S1TAU4_9RHOD